MSTSLVSLCDRVPLPAWKRLPALLEVRSPGNPSRRTFTGSASVRVWTAGGMDAYSSSFILKSLLAGGKWLLWRETM